MHRKLIGLIFGIAMAVGASAADVVVRVASPRAVVETRGPGPGTGYVWVDGYHRWDGHAYVWAPGRWERPPRARAHRGRHHWSSVTVGGFWWKDAGADGNSREQSRVRLQFRLSCRAGASSTG
jgi:hypothetical protein